jgi:hypothetical protein
MYGYGWKSQLSRETSFHDVFGSLVIVSPNYIPLCTCSIVTFLMSPHVSC